MFLEAMNSDGGKTLSLLTTDYLFVLIHLTQVFCCCSCICTLFNWGSASCPISRPSKLLLTQSMQVFKSQKMPDKYICLKENAQTKHMFLENTMNNSKMAWLFEFPDDLGSMQYLSYASHRLLEQSLMEVHCKSRVAWMSGSGKHH
jgi:hypothetical protein